MWYSSFLKNDPGQEIGIPTGENENKVREEDNGRNASQQNLKLN